MYGGVGIYISNNITKVQTLDNIALTKTCRCSKCEMESLFLKVSYMNDEYVIAGIYRHPNGTVNHFVNDLEATLNKIDDKMTTVIVGDMNIDIIKFENDNSVNYLTTFLSHRYLPLITLPTRITDFSATCIDHIFIKIPSNKKSKLDGIAYGILYCDISDHLPCFLSLKCKSNANLTRPMTRIFGDKNCLKFVEAMEIEPWEDLYEDNNDWYSVFVTRVRRKFETCFPVVQVSRKRLKDKAWVTKGLKISIKTNHRLYRSTLRETDPRHVIKYKTYKNELRKRLKAAEERYYHQLFDDTKNSAYNLWKNLGPVINPKKIKRNQRISKLCCDGNYETDSVSIANFMNDYFCRIGKNLQQRIPTIRNNYSTYMPDIAENTFFLSPTSVQEIEREIKLLNPKKASGPDNIGAKVLKLCPHIFASNLSKIYNRSIEMGEYPAQLKLAKVIALFKKGDKLQPNNYRPISLLSCFNKIFEKILCRKLVKFLEFNKILFKYQYGFRKLYSTTLALVEFTDTITRYLDEGKYCISIFVDLTKAFDTVDHEILLHKLEHYGIRGHANNFFRSYLTNRLQYTVANDSASSTGKIECGVPQGSVLGPLFFALYINDIHHSVGTEYVKLFADDTALFMSHPDLTALIANIKSKFEDLFKWCISNKLTINAEKTNFVLFHAINKPMPQQLNEIETEFMTIMRVKSFKYLGLTLDETLNWNEHVNELCKSLIKYFVIFNHIKYKITPVVVRQLYYAFIYSRIKYGIELYGSSSASNMNKVQVIQNKLLKMVLKLDRLMPTNDLHKNIKILKIDDIHKCNTLGLVNEMVSDRCPAIFRNYFEIKENSYDLRTRDQLTIPLTRLNLGQHAVRVKGASLWNKIDKSLLNYRFKKTLKQHLTKFCLNKY